jgi:hypothetical protein
MNTMETLQAKLADLYAGEELDTEGEALLEAAGPDVRADAESLRSLVAALRADPGPEFTEETSTRILLQMQLQGASLPSCDTSPQYQMTLPI